MTTPPTDPRANPMAGNPLQSRDDLQQAVRDLVEPVVRNLSPGGARARLGSFGAAFPMRVAELEGYARPLWGIVPLVAGGGEFEHWDHWVEGLANGTDPDHPEHWGACEGGGPDQRMVEMAAIGFALAFVPERLWDPLTGRRRDQVVEWLRGIERYDPAPNNWQYFRLLVQLGLERVGVDVDQDARRRSTELIESYYRGDGWYHDGFAANIDYYVPFAFHTYGLTIAASGLGDRDAAARYVERAHRFAPDFRVWFDDEGGAVPLGRSLTYRFAQGSFWGALAMADEEALPWGEVRGLALRHLRWWSRRPISDRDGVLSVGYGYDNRAMCESYNSAGSPYWAMKAFMMLAAPADHPFWTTPESCASEAGTTTIPQAGMVVGHEPGQAVALVAQPSQSWAFLEQTRAKYKKFAYSSRWGFSGELEALFGTTTTDSMLTLVDPATDERQTRNAVVLAEVADGLAYARWYPFPDVRVDTVLFGGAPWHGRIHRVETARRLDTTETGFALPREPVGFGGNGPGDKVDDGAASCASEHGRSTLVDLGEHPHRSGEVRSLAVNANVMAPHTAVPAVTGRLEPGIHVLSCAVGASRTAAVVEPARAPTVPPEATALLARMVGVPTPDAPRRPNLARVFTARDGDGEDADGDDR
jgi:hypothetical protein